MPFNLKDSTFFRVGVDVVSASGSHQIPAIPLGNSSQFAPLHAQPLPVCKYIIFSLYNVIFLKLLFCWLSVICFNYCPALIKMFDVVIVLISPNSPHCVQYIGWCVPTPWGRVWCGRGNGPARQRGCHAGLRNGWRPFWIWIWRATVAHNGSQFFALSRFWRSLTWLFPSTLFVTVLWRWYYAIRLR